MCNVVFSCLAVASTAAGSPARHRNFVDPGYSSWSRCVEVRESDDACAKRVGFRVRPPGSRASQVLAAPETQETPLSVVVVRVNKVPILRQYSPGFPVKPCNIWTIAVRASSRTATRATRAWPSTRRSRTRPTRTSRGPRRSRSARSAGRRAGPSCPTRCAAARLSPLISPIPSPRRPRNLRRPFVVAGAPRGTSG